jgi:hypothetical protein
MCLAIFWLRFSAVPTLMFMKFEGVVSAMFEDLLGGFLD